MFDKVIFVIVMTIVGDLIVLAVSDKPTVKDFVRILPTVFVMVSIAHLSSMLIMCIKGV